MKHLFTAFLFSLAAAACTVAPSAPSASKLANVSGATTPVGMLIPLKNPSFMGDAQGKLTDWTAIEHAKGQSYTFVSDPVAAYSAPGSARIHRYGTELFGLLDQTVRVQPEWVNKTIRLSGFLKTEKADGEGGALVLQATGGGGNVMTHNHMDTGRVKGSKDWSAYAVDIKVPPGAYMLRLGAMLEGGGTLWADDLTLTLVD